MKDIWKNVIIKIPKNYKVEFERETLLDNFQRMSYISILLFVVEVIMYLLRGNLLNTGNVVLYFIFIDFAFIPVIWFFYKKINKTSTVLLQTVQLLYALTVLSFGISLSFIALESSDLVYMYFMMVFGVAFILYLRSIHCLLLLFSALIVFIIFLPLHMTDTQLVFVIISNACIVNLFAFVLSRMFVRMRLSLFLDGKMIREKNDKLEELLQTDPMTRLYNHEAAFALLDAEIKRFYQGYPFSVIIADIDSFKRVNDSYGHLCGDHVIKKTAKALTDAVRESDKVCRYGGEEFLIIMPETDLASAVACAERIQETMKTMEFNLDVFLTLSGGISQYTGETADEIINKTDEKLYRAKRLGKNRFES